MKNKKILRVTVVEDESNTGQTVSNLIEDMSKGLASDLLKWISHTCETNVVVILILTRDPSPSYLLSAMRTRPFLLSLFA